MATVRIGDRDLDVKPSSLGFLKRKLLPAKAAVLAAKTEEETIDAVVSVLLLYVGHNPGIDAEWLLDNVPENPSETVAAVTAAAGQKAGPPGEAKSP
jgi:hypothetical protein